MKALKEAAALADGAAVEPATAAEPEKPMLKFRNYAVKDEKNIAHERVGHAGHACMQLTVHRCSC